MPGLEAASYYRAASTDEVGGDFYDLFSLSHGGWGVFLGDVCGKGADAAAVTSLARYTLRAAAVHGPDPVTRAGDAQHGPLPGTPGRGSPLLHRYLRSGHPRRRRLHRSAGQWWPPAGSVAARDGAAEYQHTSGGTLVGVFPDADFVATTVKLRAGDTLLLYNDDLIEARVHATAGRYGPDGLLAFANELGPTTASAAVAAITNLLADVGDGLSDDAAVLALSVAA